MFGLLVMNFEVYARAGGGGKGSGGGGAGVAVIVGLLYGIYRIRRARMMIQAKKQFEKANANDPSWNLEHFKETSEKIFYKYQEAWMYKKLSPLKGVFHPDYLKKSQRILDTTLRGKINILEKIELKSVELMSVLDVRGQNGDMFVLELKFDLIDYTIEENTRRFVDSTLSRDDDESFESWEQRARNRQQSVIEYWVFIRQDGRWLLYNIHQVDSFFGDLKHASVNQLKKILAQERIKAKDAPVDDSFFYKKVD